jgi:hypothetical protein
MNFGFIVPTCCRNILHFNQLNRCIKSIQNYYPEIYIILINDSDDEFNLIEYYKNNKYIIIKKSIIKGSADQQVFKVLLENKYFEKGIIIQDSMMLNDFLPNLDDVTIKFLWYFTNHRLHWDIIKEPLTDFNIKNNIITHTDLIKFILINDYNEYNEFVNFSLNKLNYKNEWVGCFGNLCIIDKKTLNYMNNKINFINKFIKSNTNRERRVNESIFSLICYYCFPNKNFEDSIDGLYYDGINDNINKYISTGFDNLTWCCKNKYISKISFER